MQSGSKSFESARNGLSSPLAKRLFAIDGVTGVFFGSDFVTVTKSEQYVWSVLKPEIFAAIMEHFTSGVQPISTLSLLSRTTSASWQDHQELSCLGGILKAWRRVLPAPSAWRSQDCIQREACIPCGLKPRACQPGIGVDVPAHATECMSAARLETIKLPTVQ